MQVHHRLTSPSAHLCFCHPAQMLFLRVHPYKLPAHKSWSLRICFLGTNLAYNIYSVYILRSSYCDYFQFYECHQFYDDHKIPMTKRIFPLTFAMLCDLWLISQMRVTGTTPKREIPQETGISRSFGIVLHDHFQNNRKTWPPVSVLWPFC